MFTIAPPAFSTAERKSARYFASSDRKCSLHGSILLMLNFDLTWGRKSFRSIFGEAALPFLSWTPAMKSRKGYEAIAIRSRGAAGNCRLGPAGAAKAVFKRGDSMAAAVVT